MTIIEDLITHLQIRLAAVDDLSELEWGGELSHFRKLYAEAYRLMQSGDVLMWVATLPGVGIVGQLFVHMYHTNSSDEDADPSAYIYGFRVRPQFRGRGIGSQLLLKAENELIQRGFKRITLNVARDNQAARRLYERFGYQVVAAEPGIWSYIDDKGIRQHVTEPAWRMQKKIDLASE
mgnify:CR=1 FL=1